MVVFQYFIYGILCYRAVIFQRFRYPGAHNSSGNLDKGIAEYLIVILFSQPYLFIKPSHSITAYSFDTR